MKHFLTDRQMWDKVIALQVSSESQVLGTTSQVKTIKTQVKSSPIVSSPKDYIICLAAGLLCQTHISFLLTQSDRLSSDWLFPAHFANKSLVLVELQVFFDILKSSLKF